MIESPSKKIKILFVCTGNIYRSMVAEYCLKKYLSDNKITHYEVSSAGTCLIDKNQLPQTLSALKDLGVDASKHKKRSVSKKLLLAQDFIVAMAKDHKDFIRKEFGLKSYLFNELALDLKKSVTDIEYLNDADADFKKIKKTVKHISMYMPNLFSKIDDYFFLFENFLKNKKSHMNGFRPIMLFESEHSAMFMSMHIPRGVGAHLLVIPKKRYKNLEDVPSNVLFDLMETVKFAGIILKKIYPAYNVLLNNGREANQYMFHVHFHIIPRFYGDEIIIEKWSNQKLSEKDFVLLNKKIKRLIKNELEL